MSTLPSHSGTLSPADPLVGSPPGGATGERTGAARENDTIPPLERPLRILLTISFLVHRTGAEMFTYDLALGLRRRGHAVTVFGTAFGDMADSLRHASIACVTDLADMAARPDVIMGNAHHETVRALLHFHDVPVLTICHDRSAYQSRPAPFAQAVCHVAVDENCAERLAHEFGIARERIELIQNGVDLTRFRPRPALPAALRKALVFSNYATHDAQIAEVRAACVARGLSLDVFGLGAGNILNDPATALGNYDVVFGKGRCATEALVTGTAVVVLDPSSGMGEMVTAATAAHARRWNFGRALLTRPITRENVGAELDRYDANDAREAGVWMRAHGSLDAMLVALENCARRLMRQCAFIDVPAEQRAQEIARYMDDWVRRGSLLAAHVELAALRQHTIALQQNFNEHHRADQARFEAVQAEVQRHAALAASQAVQLQATEAQRHVELAASQARELQATEAAHAAFGTRLIDAEQQVARARAELDGLQAQLRGVYASHSWHVTAPLRLISSLFQSIARRA